MKKKQLLIVQFRPDQDGDIAAKARKHEESCLRSIISDAFQDRVAIQPMLDGTKDNLDTANLKNTGAIILGGSRRRLHPQHVRRDWPSGVEAIHRFVEQALENDIPILGICFGFQLLGRVYGASIGEFGEKGSVFVEAVEEAAKDPLISQLGVFGNGKGGRFMVQHGHHDGIVDRDPPKRMIYLAYDTLRGHTRHCEAFRIEGKKAWGVLFHPDLDREAAIERYRLFTNLQTSERQARKLFCEESPEATRVIPSFLKAAGLINEGI